MIVGVDGCLGGWIAVSTADEALAPEAQVFADFKTLLAAFPDTAVVAVDMPIGLPDISTQGGRGAEHAVRPHLGGRKSSVFSVPSRSAIYAHTAEFPDQTQRLAAHRAASEIALQTSQPPRKISIQAFGLFPKIRQLDAAMCQDVALKARVFESHPEFAFTVLNNMKPMATPKKIGGKINPEGMNERRAILAQNGMTHPFLDQSSPKGANRDDFLDACVMMLIAARIKAGTAKPHPSAPVQDSYGLRIAIWA